MITAFAQSLHHSLWIMLGKVGSFFIPFSALNFLMLVGFVTIVAIHGSYDFRDICQHAGPLLHRCLCFLRNKTIHTLIKTDELDGLVQLHHTLNLARRAGEEVKANSIFFKRGSKSTKWFTWFTKEQIQKNIRCSNRSPAPR